MLFFGPCGRLSAPAGGVLWRLRGGKNRKEMKLASSETCGRLERLRSRRGKVVSFWDRTHLVPVISCVSGACVPGLDSIQGACVCTDVDDAQEACLSEEIGR